MNVVTVLHCRMAVLFVFWIRTHTPTVFGNTCLWYSSILDALLVQMCECLFISISLSFCCCSCWLLSNVIVRERVQTAKDCTVSTLGYWDKLRQSSSLPIFKKHLKSLLFSTALMWQYHFSASVYLHDIMALYKFYYYYYYLLFTFLHMYFPLFFTVNRMTQKVVNDVWWNFFEGWPWE